MRQLGAHRSPPPTKPSSSPKTFTFTTPTVRTVVVGRPERARNDLTLRIDRDEFCDDAPSIQSMTSLALQRGGIVIDFGPAAEAADAPLFEQVRGLLGREPAWSAGKARGEERAR